MFAAHSDIVVVVVVVFIVVIVVVIVVLRKNVLGVKLLKQKIKWTSFVFRLVL